MPAMPEPAMPMPVFAMNKLGFNMAVSQPQTSSATPLASVPKPAAARALAMVPLLPTFQPASSLALAPPEPKQVPVFTAAAKAKHTWTSARQVLCEIVESKKYYLLPEDAPMPAEFASSMFKSNLAIKYDWMSPEMRFQHQHNANGQAITGPAANFLKKGFSNWFSCVPSIRRAECVTFDGGAPGLNGQVHIFDCIVEIVGEVKTHWYTSAGPDGKQVNTFRLEFEARDPQWLWDKEVAPTALLNLSADPAETVTITLHPPTAQDFAGVALKRDDKTQSFVIANKWRVWKFNRLQKTLDDYLLKSWYSSGIKIRADMGYVESVSGPANPGGSKVPRVAKPGESTPTKIKKATTFNPMYPEAHVFYKLINKGHFKFVTGQWP
jgi:hypothetical protein